MENAADQRMAIVVESKTLNVSIV
jgi:hypothetical protein